MQYPLAWPPCHCLNSVHTSICQALCPPDTATLWALLSPHTPEPPTTVNTADSIRIQHCWVLAVEVDKNVSLSSCVTSCHMAAAKTACLCPRSLRMAKQLFQFELTHPAHRSLEASDMSPTVGEGKMWWADRHWPLRNPKNLPSPRKSEVVLLNSVPWMGYPRVPPTERLQVGHPTNPPERLTHLWISAISTTWAKPPATFHIHFCLFFGLKWLLSSLVLRKVGSILASKFLVEFCH